MLPVVFGFLAALSTAIGLMMTKSITTRMPVWQVVGPLFILNALLVAPAVPFGPRWQVPTPEIFALHALSTVLLAAGAACVFLLITRGRASSVSVGRAVSPVSVLLVAPLILGTIDSPFLVVGAIVVMLGALVPLRREFEGLSSGLTIALLAFLGLAEGTVTVLTASLALQGVGLPEIYIVRTVVAGVIFTTLFPPKDLHWSDLKPLSTRAVFVTAGYVFTILGVRDGDVVPVQSLWATAPLLVIFLEWMRYRVRPHNGALVGAAVVAAGVFVLLRASL